MQSRTSLFNRRIFSHTLLRFWPIWALALAADLLIVPGTLFLNRGWGTMHQPTAQFVASTLLDLGSVSAVVNLIFAALSAMAVFSWLYSERSSIFHASLPVNRSCLFLSVWTAGLCWQWAVPLLTAAVTLLLELFWGAADVPPILWYLSFNLMEILFFYGLASFCAVLTGNLFVLPLLYLVFNFLFIVVGTVISEVLSMMIRGVSFGPPAFVAYLTPLLWILTGPFHGSIDGYPIPDVRLWLYLGCIAAAGLALTALAWYILRRRRMESAGDVVAVPVLKPVFRWCMAFGCALVLGALLYLFLRENDEALSLPLMLICFLVTGAVGWFGSEMLMCKSYRVFNTWRGALLCLAIIAALLVGSSLDLLGIGRYIPPTEQVEFVSLNYGDGSMVFTEPEDINMVCAIHREALDEMPDADSPCDEYLSILYSLKNGRVISRHYSLYTGETPLTISALEAFLNRPENILRRAIPEGFDPEDISYASAAWYTQGVWSGMNWDAPGPDVRMLHDAVLEDAAAGRICRADVGRDDHPIAEPLAVLTFEFQRRVEEDGESWYTGDSRYYKVWPESTSTLAAMQALGLAPDTDYRYLDADSAGAEDTVYTDPVIR